MHVFWYVTEIFTHSINIPWILIMFLIILIEALEHSCEVTKSLLSWALYFNAVMGNKASMMSYFIYQEVIVPWRKLKRVQDIESPKSGILLW